MHKHVAKWTFRKKYGKESIPILRVNIVMYVMTAVTHFMCSYDMI